MMWEYTCKINQPFGFVMGFSRWLANSFMLVFEHCLWTWLSYSRCYYTLHCDKLYMLM